MIYWLGCLSYFLVMLGAGRVLGFRPVYYVLVLLAAVVGGGVGYVFALMTGVTPREALLHSPMPAAFSFTLYTCSWLTLYYRHQPRRNIALLSLRRVVFADEAQLESVLDRLEDRVAIRYVPGGTLAADSAWAYESWAEVLEEAPPTTSFTIVPGRARLRVAAGEIQACRPTASVLLVRSNGEHPPVAVPASDAPFCRQVMRELTSCSVQGKHDDHPQLAAG